MTPYLVSFSDAARRLSITSARLRSLIDAGLLTPHPILADRILLAEVERFAYNGHDAQADDAEGRTVDSSPAEAGWQTPPLRLRSIAR